MISYSPFFEDHCGRLHFSKMATTISSSHMLFLPVLHQEVEPMSLSPSIWVSPVTAVVNGHSRSDAELILDIAICRHGSAFLLSFVTPAFRMFLSEPSYRG